MVYSKLIVVGLVVVSFAGGWWAHGFFHPPVEKVVTLPPDKITDTKIVEKTLHVPYEVAKEIVREVAVVKEVKVPVKDADKVVVTPATPTESPKQYNIVLDRRWEAGVGVSNHGIVGAVQYNPDKYTGIELMGNREFGALLYKVRF